MNRGNMSLFKNTEYGGYSAPRRPVWRQGSRTARKSFSSRPEVDAIDGLPETLLLGQQNNDMSWYQEPHHPQHYQQYPQQPYGNQFQHASQYQRSPPDNKENTCDRNDLRYYISPRINANRHRSWSPDHRRHRSSTPSKWNRRHEDMSIERSLDRRRRSPRRRRSSRSPHRYKSRSRSRFRSRTRSCSRSRSRSPHQRRKRSRHVKKNPRSQSSSSSSESVTSVASDSSVLVNTFPKRRNESERWRKRQSQSLIKKIHNKNGGDYQSVNPYKWVNPEFKFKDKETPTVEVTIGDLLMSPISSEDFSQRSGEADSEGENEEIDSKAQKTDTINKEEEKEEIDGETQNMYETNMEGKKEEINSKILKNDKTNMEVEKKELYSNTLKTDQANKEVEKNKIDSKSRKTNKANKERENEEIDSKTLETDKTNKEPKKQDIHSKILKNDKAIMEVEKKEIDTKIRKTDKKNKEGKKKEIDSKRQKIEKSDKGEKKEIFSKSLKTDKASKEGKKEESQSKIQKKGKANKQTEKKEIDSKRHKIEKAHKEVGHVEMDEVLEDKTKNEIISSVKICRGKSNLDQGSIEKLKETLQKTKSNPVYTQMIDRVLSILPNKKFRPATERAKNTELDTFESESKEHAKKLKQQIEKSKDNDSIQIENDSSMKIFRDKSNLDDNNHDKSRQEKHIGMSKDKKDLEKTKDEQTTEKMCDRKHNAISEIKKRKEKSKHHENLNGKTYNANSNKEFQTIPPIQEINGPSSLNSGVIDHPWVPIGPEIKELQEICKSPPKYMSQSSTQNVNCNFSDGQSRIKVPVKQIRFLVSESMNTKYSQNSNKNLENSENSKKIKDSDRRKEMKMPPTDLNQSRSYLLSLEEKKNLFEAQCSKVKETVEKEKKSDSERKVTMVKDSIVVAMRENKERTLKIVLDKIDPETSHKKSDSVGGAHNSIDKMPNMQRERKSSEAKHNVHDQSYSPSSFEKMSIQRERLLSGVMEATQTVHDKVHSHSNGDNGGISNPEPKMKTISRERRLTGVKEDTAIAHDKVSSHSKGDNGSTNNSDSKITSIPRERRLSGVKETTAIAHDNMSSHIHGTNGSTRNSDGKMTSIPTERQPSIVKETTPVVHDKMSLHSNRGDEGSTFSSVEKMKGIPRERRLSGVKETTLIVNDKVSSHSNGDDGSSRNLDGKMRCIPRERRLSGVKETIPIVHDKVSSQRNEGSTFNSVENMRGIPKERKFSGVNDISSNSIARKRRASSDTAELSSPMNNIKQSLAVITGRMNRPSGNIFIPLGKQLDKKQKMMNTSPPLTERHSYVSEINQKFEQNTKRSLFGKNKKRISRLNDLGSCNTSRQTQKSQDFKSKTINSPPDKSRSTTSNKHPFKQFPLNRTGRKVSPGKKQKSAFESPTDNIFEKMDTGCSAIKRTNETTLDHTNTNEKRRKHETEDSEETVMTPNDSEEKTSKNKHDSVENISKNNDNSEKTSKNNDDSEEKTSKNNYDSEEKTSKNKDDCEQKTSKNDYDSEQKTFKSKVDSEEKTSKNNYDSAEKTSKINDDSDEKTSKNNYDSDEKTFKNNDDSEENTSKHNDDSEEKTSKNSDDSEEKTSKINDDSDEKTSKNNYDSEEKTFKNNDDTEEKTSKIDYDSEEKTSKHNDDSEEKTSKNNEERLVSKTVDRKDNGEIKEKLCKSIEKTSTKEIVFEEKACAKEKVCEENDFSEYDDDSDIEPIEMIGSVYIETYEDDVLSNLAIGEGEHIRYGDDRIVLQELDNDSDTKDIENVDSKDIEHVDSKNNDDVDSTNIADIDAKDIEDVVTMDDTKDINDVDTKDDTTDVDNKDIKDSNTKDIVDGKTTEPLKSTIRKKFTATLEVIGKLWEEEKDTENEVQVTIISPKKCPVINDAESSDDDGDLEFSSGVEFSPIKSADKSLEWLKMAKKKLKVPVGLSKIQLDQDPGESDVNMIPELHSIETFSKKVFGKGFVVEHTKLLKNGYTEKTVAHLYPKKLYRTSRANMKNLGKCLLCRTCSMYFSPLAFTAHHDTNNVMMQIDPVKCKQEEFRLVEAGDMDTKRIFRDFTLYFHAERSKRCHSSPLKVLQTVEENDLPSAGQVVQQNLPVVQSAVSSVCSKLEAPSGNPHISDGTSPIMAVPTGSPPTSDGTSPILAVQSAITVNSHTSNHVKAPISSEKSELTNDKQSSSPHVTHTSSTSVIERTLLQETTDTVAASSEERSAETSRTPNCNQPTLVGVSQSTTNQNVQQQSSRPSQTGQLIVSSEASLTYPGNGPGQHGIEALLKQPAPAQQFVPLVCHSPQVSSAQPTQGFLLQINNGILTTIAQPVPMQGLASQANHDVFANRTQSMQEFNKPQSNRGVKCTTAQSIQQVPEQQVKKRYLLPVPYSNPRASRSCNDSSKQRSSSQNLATVPMYNPLTAPLINQNCPVILNQNGQALMTQNAPALMTQNGLALVNQNAPALMTQNSLALENQNAPALMMQNGLAVMDQQRTKSVFQSKPSDKTSNYTGIPIAAPQGIPVIIPDYSETAPQSSRQTGSTATQNVNYSLAMEQIEMPGVVEPVQPTSSVQSTSPADTGVPRSMPESAKNERWQELVSEMCALTNINTPDSGLNMILLANVLKMEGLVTVNHSILRMAQNRVARANREQVQQKQQEQEHRQQQQRKELQRMQQQQQLLQRRQLATEEERAVYLAQLGQHKPR